MPDGIHLHLFCKRCGSTFLNVKKLLLDGTTSCHHCGKKRQFTLDRTNINPTPGSKVTMIGDHNITQCLDGHLSELKMQKMLPFPTTGWVPLATLTTILHGLVENNTIYIDEELEPIYKLLSRTHIFSMLVKMYQELIPPPEEIINELHERGIAVVDGRVMSWERPFDAEVKELISKLKVSLDKESLEKEGGENNAG